jgi:uroporphyrinogen-III decarboxylase
LTAKLRYDETMQKAGATLMPTEERVVKSPEDYRLVGDLFEDLEVERDDRRYRAFQAEVGEEGVAVAFAHLAASPVHHLLKELVPYDQFYFDLHDDPALILETAARMEPYVEQVLAACAESTAEVVFFGANYDVSLTPPRLFEEHFAPGLKRAADLLHAHGKLLLTHTDGENDGLNRFYAEAGVDVADSVCPSPMTRLSLREYREQLGTQPAIWGGLCSICVLPESFTEAQFEEHVQSALESVGDGRGIVFSLADTTPPAADVRRIRRIGQLIADS